MALRDDIALALADCASVTGGFFVWGGQPYACTLNAEQNVLVTSKTLFAANGFPGVGDKIRVAAKDRQVTAIANAAEEFVAGGLAGDNDFVDDPANPSLAIQFGLFIGK